ncbi:hypothetical protein AB0L05_34695 [Nonomuraea pusilla]|uniref:hypothetical protein n=1 Tax=Nonomuraea pusilla TaxID=46177 RepID=UPI00332E6547
MKARFAIAATLSALALLSGCTQQEEPPVDRTPLPSVAAPPYACDYIPLDAVRLMTGVRDPIVDGSFNLEGAEKLGIGGCFAYQPTGDKAKVLNVSLSPGGSKEEAEHRIRTGAKRLPDIVPGAVGYLVQDGSADNTHAAAVLIREPARLIVELVRGVKGRDNAADVVALTKLIAPKLITDASAPSPSTKD